MGIHEIAQTGLPSKWKKFGLDEFTKDKFLARKVPFLTFLLGRGTKKPTRGIDFQFSAWRKFHPECKYWVVFQDFWHAWPSGHSFNFIVRSAKHHYQLGIDAHYNWVICFKAKIPESKQKLLNKSWNDEKWNRRRILQNTRRKKMQYGYFYVTNKSNSMKIIMAL